MVHDILDDGIILAQTDPPIPRRFHNKPIIITYLLKERGGFLRKGFAATIMDFIGNYLLSSQRATQALAVTQKSDPAPYNLRMFHRIMPTSTSGFGLALEGKKLNIMNVSVGGVCFSHGKIHRFAVNSILPMTVTIYENEYAVKVKVKRIWKPEIEKMVRSLEYVAIQFIGLDKRLKDTMGRKILDVERMLRFKELFP